MGYFSKTIVPENKVQLIGVTAVFIACKIEEIMVPMTSDMCYLCKNVYSEEEINNCEIEMGRVLKWRFVRCVP